jgi:tetratricopeptide (TPR) repeat protein
MMAATYLLFLAFAAGQSPTIIRQTTTGWCSPIISNVNGNVTVNCKGVDPRALKRLNAELVRTNQELEAKIEEANEWVERYHELELRLSEPGPDSELFRQAREYLHQGEFDKANEILDRILDDDEKQARELAAHQYVKGLAEQIQFRPVEALPHFEKAYRFRPENPTYGLKYGQSLVEENEFRKAEPVLEDTLDRAREIEKQHPDTKSPNLARLLRVQGDLYRSTNRFKQAEDKYNEALDLYSELAKSNPARYSPSVVNLQSALGILYARTNRLDQSEAIYRQAIVSARALPDQPFNRNRLATCLNNLATFLVRTQRLKEAEAAIEESAAIERDLVKSNPRAFEPYLVTILGNVALVYDDEHRFLDAERALHDALDICKRLVEENPSAYKPNEASTWAMLGAVMNVQGRHEEAEASYRNAVDIERTLAKRNPEAYEPRLARNLTSLAMDYSTCNRVKEAEDTFQEALVIERRLLRTDFDSFAQSTILALQYLGLKNREAKDPRQAEAFYREAVDVCRRQSAEDPGKFEPGLAQFLESLGWVYLELGDSVRARQAADEAIDILTRLAANDRAQFGDRLAMCLYIDSEAIKDTDPARACNLKDRALLAASSPSEKHNLESLLQTCRESGLSEGPKH